jgi:arylsulfatase A-like enzyme
MLLRIADNFVLFVSFCKITPASQPPPLMKFPVFLTLLLTLGSVFASAANRPNIVWIIPDDMSAHFSTYGETTIETPHLDAMAERGTKFTRAFVTAPVCSTNRSAFITGMYQTTIGAHHHRSGRGEIKINLPADVKLVPQLFQEAGYYTTIAGWPVNPQRRGKTDYNFEWDPSVYDGSDWSGRAEGQPFFAQIQTPGGKLRGSSIEQYKKIAQRADETLGSHTSPDDVTLPPYYPNDNAVLRQDWAAYLDSVRLTDAMIGEVLARLEAEGELDNTIVIFMTDHGISHARGKQFLYEEGIHVPFVVQGPGIEAGTVRNDLIEHIDIAALSLAAAGIDIPASMQAQDIFAADYTPRDAAYSARDRCDETVDYLRSVRTERIKYIRNYLHQRPHMMPNRYKDAKTIIVALREAHAAGELTPTQAPLFAPTRAPEELYDLVKDPHELNNLAGDPKYASLTKSMRWKLRDWEQRTGDKGRETAAMYDSDIVVQTAKVKNGNPDQLGVFLGNVAQMKAWDNEGK